MHLSTMERGLKHSNATGFWTSGLQPPECGENIFCYLSLESSFELGRHSKMTFNSALTLSTRTPPKATLQKVKHRRRCKSDLFEWHPIPLTRQDI